MPRKKAHVRSGSKAGPSSASPPVLPQRSSSIATPTISSSPSSPQEELTATSSALPSSLNNTNMNGSQSLTAKAESLMTSSPNNGDSTPAAISTAIDPPTASSQQSVPLSQQKRRPSIGEKSVAVLRALSRSPSQDDDHYFHVNGMTPVTNGNGHAVEKKKVAPDASVGSDASSSERSVVKAKGRFPSPLITEKPRKVFHSSIGFLVLHLYLSHSDIDSIVRGLSLFLGVVVTADVLRLNYAPFERIYEKTLGFLMRESEKTKVNGVVFYLLGTVVTLRLFPEDVACVGIMTLSWADTAASLFGRMFGSYTPPLPSPPFASRKSLAGFMAAAVAGAGIAALFWGTGIAAHGERVGTGLSWLGNVVGGGVDPGATFGTAAVGTGWTGWARGFVPRPRGGVGAVLASAASLASGAAQNAAGASSSSGGGTISSWFFGKASSAASGAASTLASASTLAGASGSNVIGGKAVVPSMPLWLLSISTGLVAAVAESLELGGLDDNLTLPLLSAAGVTGVLYAWGRVGDWVLNGSGAALVGGVLGR
ncbi:hypothetical protein CF319_g1353 [Tilletia indica]|nr:hypothetical protein CF319_g1353 [Tilletia indica]